MTFSAETKYSRRAIAVARRFALSAVLLSAVGCGAGGRIYRPGNMPSELMVARSENAQTIDLSKLATFSINNEIIDRGDVLEVAISAGNGIDKVDSMPVRVGDDGIATIPIVGRLPLVGLEMQSAEQAIAAAGVERGLYKNPTVTVTMKRRRMNRITVVGAVKNPGTYELPRGGSTLLAAIVAAGNLAKEAGTDVEIRRPTAQGPTGTSRPQGEDKVAQNPHQLTGYHPDAAQASPVTTAQPVSYKINLVTAALQGNGGRPLDDGDVVNVQRLDPQPVRVGGLVVKPGPFELPVNQDMRVLDVITQAGWLSNNMADKVHIIRQVPGKEEPAVIEVSLREAKTTGKGNLRLAPGDVVTVEDTPTTMFVDSIKTFFRVGFTAAMPGF